MRNIIVTALVAILLASSIIAKEPPVVSISSDPTGLTVESHKSGKKLVPGVDIYSDGTVAVRRYDGSEARKRIDRTAVTSLVESLDRTRFYKITEDSFNAEIDKSHPAGETERIFITDCPIWSLRIRRAGVTRSTKFYGLWDIAQHYPKNMQLKTLKSAFLMVYSAVEEKPF